MGCCLPLKLGYGLAKDVMLALQNAFNGSRKFRRNLSVLPREIEQGNRSQGVPCVGRGEIGLIRFRHVLDASTANPLENVMANNT